MSDKRIVWEKWVDPLNTNIDEVEYPGFNSQSPDEEDRPVEFLSEEDFSAYEDKYDEQGADHQTNKNISYNPIRIVSTPHGFVTLTEHSFASKHFDFWTMHYNKNITKFVLDTIESCDGVETVNVLTRYRVRIGFNRTLLQTGGFNLTEIKQGIEKAIINEEKDKEKLDLRLLFFSDDVKDLVEKTKNSISSNKYWGIYILPNGKIETFTGTDNAMSFAKEVDVFEKIKEELGGEIITSMDKEQ